MVHHPFESDEARHHYVRRATGPPHTPRLSTVGAIEKIERAGKDERDTTTREPEGRWREAVEKPGRACDLEDSKSDDQPGSNPVRDLHMAILARKVLVPPNGPRLSCGALKKNSFLTLRAPPASSAC